MGLRYRRADDEDDSGVDMTPMLDIVFIMLIFFIVTASFVKESGLDASRPPPNTESVVNEKGNILVRISATNDIWVDGRMIDPRALRANIERLHAEHPEGTVVIQAAKPSRNGLMVKVMDAARLAGVYDIAIADASD